jgi:hypothetical protein
LIVVGSIASLNVAVALLETTTFVAPGAGVLAATVGGVVSTATDRFMSV